MATDSEQGPLRRFYNKVSVAPAEGGAVVIHLDGRPVRTPQRETLAVPPSLGETLAEEWRSQGEHIDPTTMPLTRLANTAIDGVAWRRQAVRGDIAAMAETDLVVYRADWPAGLVERQKAAWDPIVAHAERRFGLRIVLAEGVMPVSQDERLQQGVEAALGDDPLRLAALHQLTTLTGSALTVLAHIDGAIDFETAWAIAHVDEDWNIKEWGEDAEAAARRALRKRDAALAATVLAATAG
ncbi:MAG: ATP12 family protein [Pseudomonadota bacterium]